ncbi:MAG: Serine/threonine-protein kinase PknD [Mycoplasmataceae bacterium]|nr:Serine/threonine-protein kinase PknD [Mycoplasmataceae bacterium]WNE41600.1 MAG: Serine/threonine-protein kinase PknD [Mycoplasmataceae bacterium]
MLSSEWLNQQFPNKWERKYFKEIRIKNQLEGELDLKDFAFNMILSNCLKIYLYPHINNNNFRIVNQPENSQIIQLKDAQEWLEENYPKDEFCLINDDKRWKNVPNNKGKKRSEINTLILSQNQLEGSLDLSDFINLEVLYCWDNSLTSLILPQNNKLVDLNFSINFLTSFNYSFLNPNTLKELGIFNNNLEVTDIAVFSNLINLIDLQIGNNYDYVKSGKYNQFFGSLESLKNLTRLKNLGIGNNSFIDNGLEFLPDDLDFFYFKGTKLENELKKQKSLWEINIPNTTLLKRWKKANKIIINKNSSFQTNEEEYEMIEIFSNKISIYSDNQQVKKNVDIDRNSWGNCPDCKEPYKESTNFKLLSFFFNNGFIVCEDCSEKRIRENFDEWTSGNDQIDTFIQERQVKRSKNSRINWFPYENFKNITFVGKGGFGEVYRSEFDISENFSDKNKIIFKNFMKVTEFFGEEKDYFFALKIIDNSSEINIYEFLQEVHNNWFLGTTFNLLKDKYTDMYGKPLTVTFFGVSKETNGNYIIINKYMSGGDLHKNLKNIYKNNEKPSNFITFNIENIIKSVFSEEKISFIRGYFTKHSWILNICRGVKFIHEKGIIHRDLHPGNILFSKILGHSIPRIVDFGFCCPVNELKGENLYGNLPYVAPELLEGQTHSFASDIYSLGMLIYEITSEISPFHEFDLNNSSEERKLIKEIVIKNLRPKFPQLQNSNSSEEEFGHEVDDFYKELIRTCWDKDSKKRPNINEIILELEKFEKNNLFSFSQNLKITKYIKFSHFSLNRSKIKKNNSQLINTRELIERLKTQRLENNIFNIENNQKDRINEIKNELEKIKESFINENRDLIDKFIQLNLQTEEADQQTELIKAELKGFLKRKVISEIEDYCQELLELESTEEANCLIENL